MATETNKKYKISFETFGVKIGIITDLEALSKQIVEELPKINPNGFTVIEHDLVGHLFDLKVDSKKGLEIFRDGELLTVWDLEISPFEYLKSQIRLTVAEFAESKVFLHAGAVGWKRRAILIPAQSYSGKSTLVTELIKRGARYYSDDFAVLDENGFLHPYHRDISLRGVGNEDKYAQQDYSVESLGGARGDEPIPIGIVLLTAYREENKNPPKWRPEILSNGLGIMEILAHTIPIRYNPKFSLEVLNKVAERAIICKSQRGEASEFVSLLINFFETELIK